jgi:hypothetical protein
VKLFLLLLPIAALADDAKAPVAAPSPVTYELRDLRPTGFTQHAAAGDVVRWYFDFQNDQGLHHVIYEEVGNALPARAVQSLRQASLSYESRCSLDVECATKAFCVGDCKHMYYETANAPGEVIAPDRNKCRITYFACDKAPGVPAPAPRPPGTQP